MSTRNLVENLAAHLAIRELLDRYTNALNQRDWATLEQLFTQDGSWDAGGPEMGENAFRFEGARACRDGISGLLEAAELCVQSNHAPAIEVDGASARATSTINELVLMKDAPAMMTSWGTYYDAIVQEADGEWRFARRSFRYSWIDTAGSRGQVMASFPRAVP